MMRSRLIWWYQRLRILKYRLLSDCKRVHGKPICRQPVLMVGPGEIRFNGTVNLGVFPSPFFFNGYIYIEARTPDAVIEFGDGVWFNNNSFLISDGPGISIGKGCLFGANCEIIDSDFHDTHPDRRCTGSARKGKVVVEDNVLAGSNVKILKGVRIGKNTVIGNGTVITRSIPADMLAFGNPAKCGRRFSPLDWKQPAAPLSQA